MKHARIAWSGAIHDAVESDGQLLLTQGPHAGRRVAFEEAVWLPPLAPTAQARTVIALGLNYADHAKELAFKAPEEPLAFMKSQASLIGHKAFTKRPPDVAYMHYECELAVVIGRVHQPGADGRAGVAVFHAQVGAVPVFQVVADRVVVGHRVAGHMVVGARAPTTMWPATRWPTTTRSATTWKTGTAPTCA